MNKEKELDQKLPAAGQYVDVKELPYNDNLFVYPVTGSGNFQIETGGRTIVFYYTAQNPADIQMRYGLNFSRPDQDLPMGKPVEFTPEYNINLSYTVKPGVEGMLKLGWGFKR